MDVSVENVSTLGRKIKVCVPQSALNEQIQTKMTKLSREARLKGFRPGKIPHNVLEKKFGQAVRLEVIEDTIRHSLAEVFKEKSLKVAGMPKIENIKDEPHHDLEFVAAVEVYPEITLVDMHDVEIEKRTATVTDADVNKMIDKLCDDLAHWNTVDRAVKSGDKIKVNFARLLKMPEASREEQRDVEMIVGMEGVLPGLSDALITKNVNDTVEGDFAYPADWAESRVAGQAVTLWVTILTVYEKSLLSLSELTEKLGLENQDQLHTEVKRRMEEELATALREEIKENVLKKLLEKNPFELPHALVEQEKEAIRKELSQQRKTEIPLEAMNHPEVEDQARRRVELGLLLNEVIKKHDIKADVEKIRTEVDRIASRFSMHAEQVKAAYFKNKELLYGVERMVLLDEAVNVMLSEMKQKEIHVNFDEVMNSDK